MVEQDLISQEESFMQLLAEQPDFFPGSLITAQVEAITPDYVIVKTGLKSESRISRREFLDQKGELTVKVGDQIEVLLENRIDDGLGETRLSYEKAQRITAWNKIEQAFTSSETILGVMGGHVRGGFTVDIGKIKAFLPGSLLDVKPVQDPSYLEGKELEFKVVKIDKQQNNVVVSRRAVLLAEGDSGRKALLESLHEGDVVTGVVKNLTDYGAFIDLGGIDGLLHITDISWKRINHPSEILKLGESIQVKILKFDQEKSRISLGVKQLVDDPWRDLERCYPSGARVFGKVTNVTDYGCFVEIEPGIEGLVHVSEMDWTNKNVNPSKLVSSGQEIEVMVLEIDSTRRRISLGMKQCQANPWKEFAEAHMVGDKVTGSIKSITDFGIFLGLGDIDGLIHISDLSWNESGVHAIRNYKKGQELEAVILGIDADRERISLGLKQLEKDIYAEYLAAHPKGSVVSGKVVEVTARDVNIDLGDDIEGHMRASDVSRDKVQDATYYLAPGDSVEAKVMGLDKKNRYINLSIKALQADLNANIPANVQLGDLLKEHISESKGRKGEEDEPEEGENVDS